MKVSVLISTFHGEDDIRPLLDSIKNLVIDREKHTFEVIIRDDGSLDDTVSIIETEYPWTHLIHSAGENIGFVASNNAAYRQATGEIICCINQDTIAHPLFIAEAIDLFLNDPDISGINTNMIMPWVMPIERFKNSRNDDIPAYEFKLTPYGFVEYQPAARTSHLSNFMTGGAFFVRRAALPYRDYLFNPNIDMYCEDSDLSLRMLEDQRKLVYSPLSIIYHNQAPRKADKISELLKLMKITRNRFALFSSINRPLAFSRKYPLLLIGIIKKTAHLGLPANKITAAYIVNTGVAMLFLCLYPYWLIQSFAPKTSASGTM